MLTSFFKKVLILRLSTKHTEFWFGVQFPFIILKYNLHIKIHMTFASFVFTQRVSELGVWNSLQEGPPIKKLQPQPPTIFSFSLLHFQLIYLLAMLYMNFHTRTFFSYHNILIALSFFFLTYITSGSHDLRFIWVPKSRNRYRYTSMPLVGHLTLSLT